MIKNAALMVGNAAAREPVPVASLHPSKRRVLEALGYKGSDAEIIEAFNREAGAGQPPERQHELAEDLFAIAARDAEADAAYLRERDFMRPGDTLYVAFQRFVNHQNRGLPPGQRRKMPEVVTIDLRAALDRDRVSHAGANERAQDAVERFKRKKAELNARSLGFQSFDAYVLKQASKSREAAQEKLDRAVSQLQSWLDLVGQDVRPERYRLSSRLDLTARGIDGVYKNRTMGGVRRFALSYNRRNPDVPPLRTDGLTDERLYKTIYESAMGSPFPARPR